MNRKSFLYGLSVGLVLGCGLMSGLFRMSLGAAGDDTAARRRIKPGAVS